MPVFQPYTCRDIRKATEDEHGARATSKDENPIGPTTCPKTSVPNSIDDPLAGSPTRSACLQIDFIRGDDFHHE